MHQGRRGLINESLKSKKRGGNYDENTAESTKIHGFMHQNTYAETRTNIQLYVPDDNQNNRQENNQTANRADNGKVDNSVAKTGDTTGGKILDYEIMLAVSAVLGTMGVIIRKSQKTEKNGD